MATATTPNAVTAVLDLVLCIAFELGASKWKMAFSTGLGQQPRHREVAARDLEAVQREIDRARARFELPVSRRGERAKTVVGKLVGKRQGYDSSRIP
ncbi:MAG TPA: hypothetical protein VF647_17860 [Longimicrobium sp.]|jgi:hypothetical protein